MVARVPRNLRTWCHPGLTCGALAAVLIGACSIDASDHATDNRTTGGGGSSTGTTSKSTGSGGGGSQGSSSTATNSSATDGGNANSTASGGSGDAGSGGSLADSTSGGEAGAAGEPNVDTSDCLEPNDDRSEACAIGDLTTVRTFSSVVGPTDANDYYEIEMLENGVLTYGIEETMGPVIVRLYEDRVPFNVNAPYHDVVSTSSQQLTDIVLEKGIYVVRVLPWSTSSAKYDLVLSAEYYSPPEPSNEPGEAEAALEVGALPELETFGGYVGGTDAIDDYRVTIPEDGVLGLQFDQVNGGVQAIVVEAASIVDWQSPLDGSLRSTSSDQKAWVLPAGDYYVRVTPNPASSNTLYALTFFQPQ